METSTCTNNDESSLLDSSAVSSVSREADKILNGEMQLSDSMREVLDGKEPGATAERPKEDKIPVTPSVLEPVDIDSALALSDITEEDDVDDDERSNKENDSYISAKSHLSSYSTASTLPCQEIPLPAFVQADQVSTSSITISYPNENKIVERGPSSASRSRKRRSLTEISELNPMANRGKNSSPAHNIYFETDL